MVAPTLAAGTPLNLAIPNLELRRRVWFNPDLKSRNYFVPGVFVNIVALVAGRADGHISFGKKKSARWSS
ncbi:MAG: hypothetical protein U0V70_03655 [Terriglobia bacterium]